MFTAAYSIEVGHAIQSNPTGHGWSGWFSWERLLLKKCLKYTI